MKSLVSVSSQFIRGKGQVKVVRFPNPKRLQRVEGLPEVGEVVLIDGVRSRVRALEMAMNLTSPPHMNESVGLCIKEVV